MNSKRLNVLVSAHELNPYGGSECAEGWNIVTRLGKYHNLTVLYARGSQFNPNSYENGLKDYFSKNPNLYNIEFIPIGQTQTTLLLSKINKSITKKKGSIGNPFLYYLGYSLWQKEAYSVAKSLCKNRKFDIIHHLTSISFREPGLLWKLPVPFVWGPTGGLSQIPTQFYKFIGYKTFTKELIRNTVNKIQFSLNARIGKAIKKSALIYTFSKEDQFIFSKRSGKKPKMLLDAAAFKTNVSSIQTVEDSKPLLIVWCGELINRKSLNLVLYAISADPIIKQKVKLQVVGTGPLKEQCQNLSESLNISSCIEWIGKVDREEVFKIMGKSDVLMHSSYREGTSHVIMEALSYGLPVICHDINGISIAIDDKSGIKVPLISPKTSIDGFKDALLKLINDSSELERLKVGAKKRSIELSWDAMAETIALDYISIHNENEQLILKGERTAI